MNFRYTKILSIATPVIALIAFISAGAGHGSYTLMILAFPAVLAISNWLADNVLLAIMILQFPIYGLIIDFAISRSKELWGWGIVVGVHVIFLCIVVTDKDFHEKFS